MVIMLRLGKSSMWKGLSRFYRLVEYVFYPFAKLPLITRFPYSNFYFRPQIFYEIFMALGLWESKERRLFTPKEGDVVLDVGADIGYYTLKAAQCVGSQGTVISVEPDPRNFEVLRRNIWSSRLQNVKLVNCALGSSNGHALFKMQHNPLFSGLVKKPENRARRVKRAPLVKVEVKTIDKLCSEMGIQRLDWVKIDVESCMSDILLGGFKILKNSSTRLIVEITDNESFDVLSQLGYSFEILSASNSKFGNFYAAKAVH